jgi:hypothetical protein
LTPRLAILGLVLAAIVFVQTLTRPPDPAAQWPQLAYAAASAAITFFYIWFVAPLIAWLASILLSRLRRALARLAPPTE